MLLTDLNRAFKTSRFSKDAKKAKIKDVELCLAKGGKYWIYEYLFAKKNRENIGSKQPSGMALKLLAVVQKHGLGVLA